jgi:hypothetical protein
LLNSILQKGRDRMQQFRDFSCPCEKAWMLRCLIAVGLMLFYTGECQRGRGEMRMLDESRRTVRRQRAGDVSPIADAAPLANQGSLLSVAFRKERRSIQTAIVSKLCRRQPGS